MKKLGLILAIIVLSQCSVFAAEQGSAEYNRLKEYKKAQREKKAQAKAVPAEKREKNFWQREASRSGLAGTGAMFASPLRVLDHKKAD